MNHSVAFPGLQAPAAGFDEPFAMLGACHERVRRSLALLQRLVEHAAAHGADAQARDAARDVLRYFTSAAPAHHEDEERHVIPALHASGDAVAVAIADRMLAEHAEIRAGWAALRPLLETLAAGTLPDAATLQAAVRRFVAVHDAHLRLEDDLAFPRAALCIDSPEALQAMGAEMARRRGVSSP